MTSNKGTIYLVQPAELVGTERYKIGMSAINNLERCRKGYKKGTRYIIIMECDEPSKVEYEIIKRFNVKFTLIRGREYFEGSEEDIKKEFYNIVSNFTTKIKVNDKEQQQVQSINPKNKEFIKITSKLCGDSYKQYYIQDDKDENLYIIRNNRHMNRILSGDGGNDDVGSIWIEENTLYDINDDAVITSIKGYSSVLGECINSDDLKSDIKLKSFDTYAKLSLTGKLVYLFEAYLLTDNMDGYYTTLMGENKINILYLFSEMPKYLLDISYQNHSNYDDSDDEYEDEFFNYFIKMGEIIDVNSLQFKIF